MRAIAPVIRAGAAVAQFCPPQVWRRVSQPLIGQLHKGGDPARPEAHAGAAGRLLEPHLPDIELLEQVTGGSFAEWKGYRDGGSFESRRARQAGSARADAGDQVVRAVGPRDLEVEARPPVVERHGGRVAQRAVGVRGPGQRPVRVGDQEAVAVAAGDAR